MSKKRNKRNVISMKKKLAAKRQHDEKIRINTMMGELTVKRDALVYEAICRTLGHTNWEYDTIASRGQWVEYADGCNVFKFDGQEKLLFHPIIMDPVTKKLVQKAEYLYDKRDFDYQPEAREE